MSKGEQAKGGDQARDHGLAALPIDESGRLEGRGLRRGRGEQPREASPLTPTGRDGCDRSPSWPGLGLERPRSAHDQMLRVLALEIMDGAFDVTGFPSETALLRRFQVSRSFLREVIRGLTA